MQASEEGQEEWKMQKITRKRGPRCLLSILKCPQIQAKEQHASTLYNASVPRQMLKKVLSCETAALPWAVPSHEVAVKTLPHFSQTSVQVQPLLSQVVR